MLAEGRLAAPEPSDHPAQVLAAYLLLALRHEVLAHLCHFGRPLRPKTPHFGGS